MHVRISGAVGRGDRFMQETNLRLQFASTDRGDFLERARVLDLGLVEADLDFPLSGKMVRQLY